MQTGQNRLPLDSPERGNVPLELGDAPSDLVRAARERGVVTWDIETSGLDWRSEKIGLCQVWVAGYGLRIVKVKGKNRPNNLVTILEDPSVQKIFHHAMFDLRFLSYHWGIKAENIVCTKIASKILNPAQPEGHTLASLLLRYLGITLDKTKRRSDWLSWDLSDDQLIYAGNDVIHLAQLFERLSQQLRDQQLEDLAFRCFAHIPTQVQLDISGYKDVFGY
jgi:ribonuclease D